MTRLHAVDYGAAKAVLEVGNSYVTIDINQSDVLSVDPSTSELSEGSWMRVAADFEYPIIWRELAEASVSKLDINEEATPERERKFRIPESVKREAALSLQWLALHGRGQSVVGEKLARHLAENTYVTAADIVKMQRYFSRLSYSLTEMAGWTEESEEFPTSERIRFAMRGGESGLAWVNKITTKHTLNAAGGFGAPVESPSTNETDGDQPHAFQNDPDAPGTCLICGREEDDPIHVVIASAFEYDGTCDYFGHGLDPDSTVVDALFMLRPDGTWARREADQWIDMEPPAETDLVIMLDEDSAYKLADIIDDVLPTDAEALPYELALLNPHEAALFYAAEPEIDYTLIDRVFDIYDSTERSVNAQKQVRGPGGKFGDGPDQPDTEKEAPVQTKARLPQALPLVPDVAALIAQYMAAAGGEPAPTPAPEAKAPVANPQQPVQAAGELDFDYLNRLIELAEAEPAGAPAPAQEAAPAQTRPLYLAIVDKVDTEAVLDVVSLMPGQPPTLWKRDKGQWVQAPEILAALQGTTPPPVVELTDDALVKNVLEQVDKSTAGEEEPEEAEAPGASPQNPDGSPNAPKPDANPDQHPVAASVSVPNFYPPTAAELQQMQDRERKLELRRAYYANSDGTYPMWGLYGEVFDIAKFAAEGGLDRNRGNAERLRRYWEHGEGAAKVRWGEPNDWYRCVQHLSKYLGVRAKGYCTLRHHAVLGKWPGQEGKH